MYGIKLVPSRMQLRTGIGDRTAAQKGVRHGSGHSRIQVLGERQIEERGQASGRRQRAREHLPPPAVIGHGSGRWAK